jgi:TolA-binding protein
VLQKIIFFFALVIGGIVVLNRALHDGSIRRYLDAHPNPKVVPRTHYAIGQGYIIFGNFTEAATHFIRIPERYPDSPLADKALFSYVKSLDDGSVLHRDELIEQYNRYLERYPNGQYADAARNRISLYRSGAR